MQGKFKAVIFDLDGTLIDTNALHAKTFSQAFFAVFKKRVSKNEILPFFGLSIREIAQKILSKNQMAVSKKEIEKFAELKIRLYNNSIKGKSLLEKNTFDFLKRLKAKGIKLAIASGTERKMLKKSLGMQEFKLFDALVCASDMKASKPNPEILLLAAKGLNARKSECLYVGDSLMDAMAAENAGMKFAAVLSGIASRKQLEKFAPLLVVKKITDLEKIL